MATLAEVATVCFYGIRALAITVQVHIAGGGLPCFSIVGLADKAVSESRERIRASLHTLGLALPAKRITMNLAPANIQKEGSHYDLPLALGVMAAIGALPLSLLSGLMALGELGLDASIKPVRGVLSAAVLAASMNKTLICPAECGAEAKWGGDMEILAPGHLLDLINHFKNVKELPLPYAISEPPVFHRLDFADIRGQDTVKRALTIAAAGRHNMVMSGPPGSGKSMLAERIMTILPALEPQESLELTMIHSVAGQLKDGRLLRQRPFRSPHHSVSMPALVGGGARGLPGEISLAHHGVLFLDELGEFQRPLLESLRQSMQTRQAVVARANHHAVYPADFQLIGAMNPCRCGYLGDIDRQCQKAPACGRQYRNNLSGPFLDRIDLSVDVAPVPLTCLVGNASGEKTPRQSPDLAEKVQSVWKIYNSCEANEGEHNVALRPSPGQLDALLADCFPARAVLLKAAEKKKMSARRYFRMINLARTIGLLDHGAPVVTPVGMAEALSYQSVYDTG